MCLLDNLGVHDRRSSPVGAAFANGWTANAIDSDDIIRYAGHAGGQVFPVALALAEAGGWTAPTRSPPPVWGEAEIEDKFRWLAAHVLEQGRIQTLVDTVRHFEDVQDVQDVRDLTTSLAGQAR
jgi:hypothetical protein